MFFNRQSIKIFGISSLTSDFRYSQVVTHVNNNLGTGQKVQGGGGGGGGGPEHFEMWWLENT